MKQHDLVIYIYMLDRLKELLRNRLQECGWVDQLTLYAKG